LGCGAPALLVQGGYRCFEPPAQIVNLRAVFVVQSGQELFDIVDQLLEFSRPFQARVLVVPLLIEDCATIGLLYRWTRTQMP
jgi:hypothetical protein